MKQRVKQVFDEWLVLSFKAGNRRALGLLVNRWNKKLIRHIYYRTHDVEVSRDIAQECWIAIIKGLKRLNDPAEFGVWALRIANNKAVDWIRKQSREKAMLEEQKNHLKTEMDSMDRTTDMRSLIREAYERLETEHRMLINLHYRQGYSVQQMAKVLQVPEGTVKSRLYKARSELKRLVGSA